MATWTEITDPADPRLGDYVRLRDTQLRHSIEATHGLYIAEGITIIERALRAGHRPRSLLLAPRWRAGVEPLVSQIDVDVWVVSEALTEHITGFHVHRGALGSFQRPELASVGDLLDLDRLGASGAGSPARRTDCSASVGPGGGASRIAIFDGLVDHANVGAGFRSAAALGVDAVLVTPTCADPLYRRSVKASMGTVFQVPWTRIDPWPGGVGQLRAAGYLIAGMTLGQGAITLDELVAEDHQRLVLVFGTEGHGLDQQVEKVLDRRVRIPMMGGVDSLNVAAASAVAFYVTRSRCRL